MSPLQKLALGSVAGASGRGTELLAGCPAQCPECAECAGPCETWDACFAQGMPQGSSCAPWRPWKDKLHFTE